MNASCQMTHFSNPGECETLGLDNAKTVVLC